MDHEFQFPDENAHATHRDTIFFFKQISYFFHLKLLK